MKRGLIALAFLSFAAVPLAAHDFWIQPARYRLAPGQATDVSFLLNDAGTTEPWNLQWPRVVSLRRYGPDGAADLQPGIRTAALPERPASAIVATTTPGTHIIAFESATSLSDLPAEQFNAYLEHEGLTAAIETRRAAGRTNERGRELYSRRAKTIVQVGRILSDALVTRPIGQTLEIVPERNPYRLRPGEPLTLRIYYRGVPLAGAQVVLADPSGGPETQRISGADGRVTFPLGSGATWRATTVWTSPITDPRADFDTIFASLSFGR